MTQDRWAPKYAVPISSESLHFKSESFLNKQFDSIDYSTICLCLYHFWKASDYANLSEKQQRNKKKSICYPDLLCEKNPNLNRNFKTKNRKTSVDANFNHTLSLNDDLQNGKFLIFLFTQLLLRRDWEIFSKPFCIFSNCLLIHSLKNQPIDVRIVKDEGIASYQILIKR